MLCHNVYIYTYISLKLLKFLGEIYKERCYCFNNSFRASLNDWLRFKLASSYRNEISDSKVETFVIDIRFLWLLKNNKKKQTHSDITVHWPKEKMVLAPSFREP